MYTLKPLYWRLLFLSPILRLYPPNKKREHTIQNIYVYIHTLIILQTKILRLLKIQRTGASHSADLYVFIRMSCPVGKLCWNSVPPPLLLRSLAPGKAKTLLEEMTFCGTIKKMITKKILDVDKGRKTKWDYSCLLCSPQEIARKTVQGISPPVPQPISPSHGGKDYIWVGQ